MNTPPPDTGSWLVEWVMTGAVTLLYALFGYTNWRIEQSKKDAIDTALRVREELLGADRTAREEIAARHLENQNNFEEVRAEIAEGRRRSQDQHNRMDDKLTRALELLGEKPSRDDVRNDLLAIKSDIATLLRSDRKP